MSCGPCQIPAHLNSPLPSENPMSVVQERHRAQAVAQMPPSPCRPRVRSWGRVVAGLA